MSSLRAWVFLFLISILWGISCNVAGAANTSVKFGRGPGNPGTVCIYDYSSNRICDPLFSVNDTTGIVTWLGAFSGAVNVGCANLPGLTGDITSPAGSCTTQITNVVSVVKGGTGTTTFTANLPILGNGSSAVIQGTRTGNTTNYVTATGTLTSGHCVSIDASGNFVDAGSSCSASAGSVNAGTINQLAFYASSGNALSGVTTLPAVNFPALTGDITTSAGSLVTTLATVPVTKGGTGDTTLTANLPLIGNGASAIAQGTRSGNTTTFATASGTLTNTHCVQIDVNGNFVDAGGTCTTGGAGGVVSSGTINQLAWYAAAGTTVSGLATANNGILATNGSGVPAIVATLPAANEPAHTGDVTNSAGSLAMTLPTVNSTPGTFGGANSIPTFTSTGKGLFTASGAITPSIPFSELTGITKSGNTTVLGTTSGTLTSGNCVQFDASGNLIAAAGPCTASGGSGTVSAGTINQLAFYAVGGTTVSGLATANNGILTTNGSGVPAIVTTVPAANEPAFTGDVTKPAGSTVTTIPTLPVGKGGTGGTTFTSNLPILGNTTSPLTQGTKTGNTTQFCTASGTLTPGNMATFDSSGNIIDGGPPCSTSQYVDINTVAGVDPTGVSDSATAIQNTINALPTTGGTILFAGKYLINSTITIGNGSLNSGSTRVGVILRGTASINGSLGNDFPVQPADSGAEFIWGGAVGGTMFQYNGPMYGYEIGDLRFDCVSSASFGLVFNSAAFGNIHDIGVRNCTGIGVSFRSIGYAQAGNEGAATTQNVRMRRFVISVPNVTNALGILLDGFYQATGSVGSLTCPCFADITNSSFSDGYIAMAGTTNNTFGIKFSNADTVNLNMVSIAMQGTGVGVQTPILLDYSATTFPGIPSNITWTGGFVSNGTGVPVAAPLTNQGSPPTTQFKWRNHFNDMSLNNNDTWRSIANAEVIRGQPQGVATLTACNTNMFGVKAIINDSSTTTFNAVAVGGSSSVVNVWCDSANWRVF